MDLFDVISNDIKEAMKAKDKVKLETLRNVKKFFLEAKTGNGCPSVPSLPLVLHCLFRRKKVKGGLRPFFICCIR